MPKSKRSRVISMARTEKRGMERKEELVQSIRDALDEYANVFVFQTDNMRNSVLQAVRNNWAGSRFFFGRNKVMQIALGREPESEAREGLHQVAANIVGSAGLLFTNKSRDEVLKFMSSFAEPVHPRAGFVPSETIVLPEGPLPGFTHPQEPYLRTQLMLPTALKMGVVTLVADYTACTAGKPLKAEQARLLKMMDRKLAPMTFKPTCYWTEGTFETF